MDVKVKWLVEPEVFQYTCQALLDTLEEKGIEHKVCAFGITYDELVAKVFSPDDCVVVYGSLQLGRTVQRKAKWVPGVYCNLPKFECLYYYPKFSKHLLNSDYAMFPLGDLLNRREWVFRNFGVDDCVFLRPSSGFKTFTGQVVELVDWDQEIDQLVWKAGDSTLVVVCRPIEITREWRLVVTDRVIAGSQYKQGRGLIRIPGSDIVRTKEVPQSVMDYGQQVLVDVQFKPDPIWTLDICETISGELRVLEVGSFSCAGLYECEMGPIVDEVNRLAIIEYEEYHLDDRSVE
jgi:hypothetical protein